MKFALGVELLMETAANFSQQGKHEKAWRTWPVQRIQFHMWVIWNLCFIKKTWARWYKTTVAYLLSTILWSGLCDFALWVHRQKDVEIAQWATPSKYWFSRCSAFFGGRGQSGPLPIFNFQMFVVKLNYQHLVFTMIFWIFGSWKLQIYTLVTTLDKTIRHIIDFEGVQTCKCFSIQILPFRPPKWLQVSWSFLGGSLGIFQLDDSNHLRLSATGLEHLGNGPRISGSCWISW